MTVHLPSYTLQSLTTHAVDIEVHVSKGMPHFAIVGMASTSVKEAKERVRSAIQQSGFRFPVTRKVVNLAPAELSKEGSHMDLAIALGFLLASDQVTRVPKESLVVGELGLEGGVRPIQSILAAVLFAKKHSFKEVILPRGNLEEASLVEGIDLIPVQSLREVVQHFQVQRRAAERLPLQRQDEEAVLTLADVSGHSAAKRALSIAAVGGHHVLMKGPPGSGKSLLAQAFLSLLPPLSHEELLENLLIHSLLGRKTISWQRPFRSVHHRATRFQLLGGGPNLLPGEISLAHRGVLFLDEVPEFRRDVLESLRQPLESGFIQLDHGKKHSTYPCAFQLIAAMNPCPCGYFGDPQKACACSPHQVFRYQAKLSGPFLDRIDLQIHVPRIDFNTLHSTNADSYLNQIRAARERQKHRFAKEAHILSNHEMSPRMIKREPLNDASKELLQQATERHALSGRAVFKLIKVARSIADLEAHEHIQSAHLLEALQYRF